MQNTQPLLFFNLEALQSLLGGSIETINDIHTLQFSNENGHGRIRYITFDDGLVAINLDVNLSENLIFSLGNPEMKALHFIFCLRGHCSHSFQHTSAVKRIEELQTAVSESTENTKNNIHIRPNINTVVNIICVDKRAYFKNKTIAFSGPKFQLTSLLNELNFHENHIHFGLYNLQIGECVKSLLETDRNDSLTESMRFEGLSHFILANHIDQLQKEFQQGENLSLLSGRELNSISNASERIKENPQESYTINMLCGITGLSPAKLQAGFKALNNRTVSDYVRHVRLLKAEQLIKTTDLNISEIVYTIGFTSRSYFCKIFKKEYGCSPKQYKQKNNSNYKLKTEELSKTL